MKIEIKEELVVRRGNKVVFSTRPEEIESVYVRAGRNHEWPTALHFLPKFPLNLQTIVIARQEDRVALDAFYDRPLEPVVAWLESNGWNMEESIANARKTPYVKVEADRAR